MKRDNKALYEKIMRSVSKQVKKALNEYGDTPEGQKQLARLQHRNIERKIAQYHKDNPGSFMPSDQEKHDSGWWDVQHYAYTQSKGKDRLRRAYDDESNSLLFPDHITGRTSRHYPHDNDIDVDELYNALETFVKEKQSEGLDIHIISGVIDGITIIGNKQDMPFAKAYEQICDIAEEYGVNPETIDKTYCKDGSGRMTKWYEIHLNVAFYDFTTNDKISYSKFVKGEKEWWDDFCAMLS